MDPNNLPKINPSKIDYWRGTRVEGRSLTRQQEARAHAQREKIQANRERYQLPATYGVRREMNRMAESASDLAAAIVSCPVVSCSKDRKRICVIAPNGSDMWVNWSQR